MKETNAAHDLLGRELKSGWKVTRKIEKHETSTGSFFSVCYEVQKDKRVCFLKAFDFAKFFQLAKSAEIVDVMADMLNAYKYEKQLSDLCKTSHVTKVVYVNEAGEETIPEYTIPVVPYLIFDLADGDVRSRLEFSDGLDFAWRLKSLHDISIGIRQLHKIEISHQDLKPSNILVFDTSSKIGDLGRSVCRLVNGPYDEMCFSGDFTYAPPEIMYKYFEKDWSKRVFATDCYLLGSMVVFYFAGTSMSALLQKNLPDKFKVHVYRGPFDQIRPYLLEAFSISLDEFKNCISNAFFKEELGWVVERLCYPLPENRGHPRNLCGIQNQFNLERFVSKFHHLHLKAEYLLGK